MMHVIDVIWSIWTSYSPWIAASLIPALITGLSISAKTAPEAGLVQKIWDIIKKVMEVLSVVTHKDQPGTFKAPLMLDKIITKKNLPPAAGILLLLSLGTGVNYGCAWFKSEAKAVTNNVIDCAKAEKDVVTKDQSLISVVLDISVQIGSAVSGGVDAVEAKVMDLIKEYGEPIVACVFKGEKPAAGKLQLSQKDMVVRATISNHDWHFKGE